MAFSKKQTFYLVVGLASLLVVIDFFVIGPSYRAEVLRKDAELNEAIQNYRPVYSDTPARNLFSLRDNYYFTLEITNPKNLTPEPRNISKKRFLSYSTKASRININCTWIESSESEESISDHFATTNLVPGTKTIIQNGPGKLSDVPVKITIKVSLTPLPIKVADSGWFWRTYEDSKVYFISMDVKKVKFIELDQLK